MTSTTDTLSSRVSQLRQGSWDYRQSLACYVYLKLRYLLVEFPENGKYNAVAYERQTYAVNRLANAGKEFEYHGPTQTSTEPMFSWLNSHVPGGTLAGAAPRF